MQNYTVPLSTIKKEETNAPNFSATISFYPSSRRAALEEGNICKSGGPARSDISLPRAEFIHANSIHGPSPSATGGVYRTATRPAPNPVAFAATGTNCMPQLPWGPTVVNPPTQPTRVRFTRAADLFCRATLFIGLGATPASRQVPFPLIFSLSLSLTSSARSS